MVENLDESTVEMTKMNSKGVNDISLSSKAGGSSSGSERSSASMSLASMS